jgi:hypothetical protein
MLCFLTLRDMYFYDVGFHLHDPISILLEVASPSRLNTLTLCMKKGNRLMAIVQLQMKLVLARSLQMDGATAALPHCKVLPGVKWISLHTLRTALERRSMPTSGASYNFSSLDQL